MLFAVGWDKYQTRILAVKGFIAEKEIEDLIVDTGFAVYIVSSQFYETNNNQYRL